MQTRITPNRGEALAEEIVPWVVFTEALATPVAVRCLHHQDGDQQKQQYGATNKHERAVSVPVIIFLCVHELNVRTPAFTCCRSSVVFCVIELTTRH